MARRFAYLVATFFLAAVSLVIGAPAAWAHATIVTTSPADGVIVKQAPTQVSATFDEPVGVSSDSLKVFSPNGTRADTGATTHGSEPSEIVVRLKPGLGFGTYTVGWHVISADSHPVQGAWTFSVGAPSSTSVNAASLNLTASPLVGFAFGFVRWVAFCCFALLVGAVGFVLWCWPGGASSPLVLRLTMGAWSGLAGSVLGALLLQGVYGAGDGVTKLFWPNVLHATLYSRYGRSLGARLILVVVALFVFTSILAGLRDDDRRASVRASVAWGILAAALAATWAAADHAGIGIQVPLSLASDILHLCSVAIWLGGLTMLAVIVLRQPRTAGTRVTGSAADRKKRAATLEAVQAVERFSPIALTCVGAILLTGTYQAWRGVGTWIALVDTTYGRLLLVKIAAMLVLIGLGYVARVRIAALRAPASAAPVRTVELVVAGLPRMLANVGGRSGSLLTFGGKVHHGGTNGAPATARTTATATVRATAWLAPVPLATEWRAARDRTAPELGTIAHDVGSRGAGANGAGANGAGSRGAGANGVGSRDAGANGSGAKDAGGNGSGANGAGLDEAGSDGALDPGRTAVTLRRLRWSVAAEAAIAIVVLAVTSILVNTATARETFTQPASASIAYNTGGAGGRGNVSVTLTPAVIGPNKIIVSVTNAAGKPYTPKQLIVALELPAQHLGPLVVALTPDGPGRYVSKPVSVTITGRWQIDVTIRSDAFDETTVYLPASVN